MGVAWRAAPCRGSRHSMHSAGDMASPERAGRDARRFTIAFVFALGAECAPWRARHVQHEADAGSVASVSQRTLVRETEIESARVRSATVGVGAPRLDEMASLIFDDVDAVAAVGLAGALRPTLKPGDIVVARATRVVTSSEARDGARSSSPKGQDLAGAAISADERILAAASRAGAIVVESLLTLDRIAGTAAEKRALASEGDAVDMESFAVVRESNARGIPAAAIRVVGDRADEDLPIDFARALGPGGTLSLRRLLMEAVRHPRQWASLVSFGLRQRRALDMLARFLDRFVSELVQ
jgi:adenosylhomocysteine nucleosidase